MERRAGIRRLRRVVWCAAVLAAGLASEARAQVVVYAQTSLATSSGTEPGLYDQLGTLAGTTSERRDLWEVFRNDTGRDVLVNKAVLYGEINSPSTAALVPLVAGTILGVPALVPDTDPAHALATASVPAVAGMGPVEVSFAPGLLVSAGTRLAFGITVPMSSTVDATFFGTDTLPNTLASDGTSTIWTGFYATASSGEIFAAFGNHYLVLAEQVGTRTTVFSNNSPSTSGQAVTFSAAVAPAQAEGTVTFRDGAVTIGDCALVSGSCDLSTAALAPGTHAITASYGGSVTYGASISSPLSQQVNPVATFTITASVAGGVGTISPAGTTTVAAGGAQTYAIAPSPGYRINYVAVNGASVGAVTSYTFSNVQRNFTITADFVPATYTITVTQAPNGYVTPYTYGGFTAGATQTYSIRPNAGYHVNDVLVDGASVGAVTSYTFSNIRANHTIAASFGQNPAYGITATAGPNGSISPSGVTSVIGGLNQTYTMTPAAGFRVAAVIVDGVNKGAPGSYTFYTVSAPHTIAATFVADTYTIDAAVVGGSGTITPSGTTTVPGGGTQAYTIAAAPGYRINFVAVNGASVGAVTSYTFSNVRRNYTITADFVPITYTITVTQTPNGYVTPYTFGGFTAGSTQTYSVRPSAGYQVADVFVDGISVGAVTSYTFTDIQGNHAIRATFGAQ